MHSPFQNGIKLKLLTCVFVPFPFLSLGPVSWPCQIPPNPMSNNAHSLACLLPVADSLGGTLALPLFRCHSCASAPQCGWPRSTADVHLLLTHCWWDWALGFDPAPFSWVFWRLAILRTRPKLFLGSSRGIDGLPRFQALVSFLLPEPRRESTTKMTCSQSPVYQATSASYTNLSNIFKLNRF